MATMTRTEELRAKIDAMREPNVCRISHEIVTAEVNWCNGCSIDHDLSTIQRRQGIDAYRKEAASRKRIAVSVASHVTILCPDCAQKLSEQLFGFRSGT